jgi:hypothetical protein
VVKVRLAQQGELELLDRERAQQSYEAVKLERSVVRVAEDGSGEPCGFIAAQKVWRVEPLVLFSSFRRGSPRVAWMRAAYALGYAMDKLLLSDVGSYSGQNCYFFFVKERRMQRLVEALGMVQVFRGGRTYARLW